MVNSDRDDYHDMGNDHMIKDLLPTHVEYTRLRSIGALETGKKGENHVLRIKEYLTVIYFQTMFFLIVRAIF